MNLKEENRIAYDKALDRYLVSRIVEEDAREAGWKKGLEESLGMPTDQIAQITGLTEDEIIDL